MIKFSKNFQKWTKIIRKWKEVINYFKPWSQTQFLSISNIPKRQQYSTTPWSLNCALGRLSTAFPVQILGKIIKNFSDLSVFPIYVIVINLDR